MLTKAILLNVLSVCLVFGQNFNGLCNEKQVFNGAGYREHPYDCSKFIQCHPNGEGGLIGDERQCSFGTYWNNDLLTCLRAENVFCQYDLCQNKPEGMQRNGEGNCRGYWECKRGKSVPLCCPSGQKYNDTHGCIDNEDAECTDDCFNDPYVAPTTPFSNETVANTTTESPVEETTTGTPCTLKAMAGEPSFYIQSLWGGLYTFVRACPQGTVFVESACNCLLAENNPQPYVCKEEIYLPFTKDAQDESGNNNYVYNENVDVHDGVATFNGINSSLVINRFTNVDISNTLVIKVKYSSNHEQILPMMERALFSNDDCAEEPSVMLCEDSVSVTAGVKTENYLSTAAVPQVPLGNETRSEKHVVYKFYNDELMVSLNSSATAVPATGHLDNIQCALHIGYAKSKLRFEGDIDEIRIYLCDPDQNQF